MWNVNPAGFLLLFFFFFELSSSRWQLHFMTFVGMAVAVVGVVVYCSGFFILRISIYRVCLDRIYFIETEN